MKCLPVPGHVTFENRPRILMRASSVWTMRRQERRVFGGGVATSASIQITIGKHFDLG